MSPLSLMVANRGEIAIRVMRAAGDLGMRTVAVYSDDDAEALHVHKADEALSLGASGAAAYLDIQRIVSLAKSTGCAAIHPGYGFLSESAAFAERCESEGIAFVGPKPATLRLFGDKVAARSLAGRLNVPTPMGTETATSLGEARQFLDSLGADGSMMVKAVAGGGGRGMRVVTSASELEEAYERCASEALTGFGNGDLYVEQLIPRARHIEVQIVGDGTGTVCGLGERECSIQRRHQKVVEIAPAPNLPEGVRGQLIEAAKKLAAEVDYLSLGTFEFLVDASDLNADSPWFFIEANARLQVEHTVTEEVTGVDLVKTQLRIAGGDNLADVGLGPDTNVSPRGYAIQARVNMETMGADGTTRPSGGVLAAFEPPSGPGVRVDTFGYAGYRTSPSFDSLLAKVIGHSTSADFADAVTRTYRALCEFKVEGVATNIGFLQAVLQHTDFGNMDVYTRFVDDNVAELVAASDSHRQLYQTVPTADAAAGGAPAHAGARVDPNDPLAVLALGKGVGGGAAAGPAVAPAISDRPDAVGPDGTTALLAPMQGTIISISVAEGDPVAAGQPVLIMESMKMEHVITAEKSGVIRQISVSEGETLFEGAALLFFEAGDVDVVLDEATEEIDLDYIRPDLAEVDQRHHLGMDEARPDMVERRRKTGQRTTRENVIDLIDEGSWIEYGSMAIAAQRARRDLDDLIKRTPADGMVAGIGRVNGDLFDAETARTVVMAYDYTVLAGTQGLRNHFKKDRMMELAEKWKLPVVFFAEGGGGRPGDTDGATPAGLDVMAFHLWGRLSGLVPLVGVTSGRCFAGNAVILGMCDVVIATEGSNIGMGGPAMVEGGGLGVFRPEEIGPMDVQVPNGVVDIAVKDEEEATAVAKKYLSYFQGDVADWEAPDQRLLRRIVPENRLRVYDVREVIETMADIGSVLEIRRGFGHGAVTAFARIEGRPVAIIANNPIYLGGAIDSDAADKATRFMQLCDAFDIPILMVVDTPGNMVGPEYEKEALVRHCCRMFVTGANVTVPIFTLVLRKSYGLGAQGMAGGSFKTPFWTVAWPTGEFGGMGLEGAVKLGFRKELAALEDPAERLALYDKMVARMYENGKAINTSTYFEIDDVIDPADTRHWITAGLESAPKPPPRDHKKRPNIDTW